MTSGRYWFPPPSSIGRAAHFAVAALGVTTSTTNGHRSLARAPTAYSGHENCFCFLGRSWTSTIAPNTGFFRVNSTTASARYSAGLTWFSVTSTSCALLNGGTLTASSPPSKSAANAGRSRTNLARPSCFNDTMGDGRTRYSQGLTLATSQYLIKELCTRTALQAARSRFDRCHRTPPILDARA